MNTTLKLDTTTDDISAATGQRYRPNDYRIIGDTAYIALTRRDGSVEEVMIDAADLPRVLSHGRWLLHTVKKTSGTTYLYARSQATIGGVRVYTYLHRLLLDAPDGMHVDHRDGQTLDCRRSNLRVLAPQHNAQNLSCLNPRNKTGYRNVQFVGGVTPYAVIIKLDGIVSRLGRYASLSEAAAAAARARVELHPYYDPRRDEMLAASLSQPRDTSRDDLRIAA